MRAVLPALEVVPQGSQHAALKLMKDTALRSRHRRVLKDVAVELAVLDPSVKCTQARTREPMAPLPGVGKKAMRAVRAVRTLHEGCQCSGWCEEMDRQIFTFVSKRPVGESIRKEGGLKGYSGGSRMRPWKIPPCAYEQIFQLLQICQPFPIHVVIVSKFVAAGKSRISIRALA